MQNEKHYLVSDSTGLMPRKNEDNVNLIHGQANNLHNEVPQVKVHVDNIV